MKFFWIFISLVVASLFCFLEIGYSRDVTLAWDSDSAVDGYKLYYKAGSSGPPYNGTGAAEGDSPVDVGWFSEFTLRALSDGEDYYFAVTAYNSEGESGYSNEATTARPVGVSSAEAGGVEPAGVDAGSGCFISTMLPR
ncbi:MAG: fibronectin type III domain-containing protein [Deltaproteobacteria bacterium]|jgi:hypothetical protein